MICSKEIECYINLCRAICKSGVAENDTAFLQSDWCAFLIECILDFNNLKPAGHCYT